jgi:hypothetical protein
MHPLIFFLVHTYVTHIVIYTDSILDYATGYTIVNDTIMLYEDIQETELSSLRRPLYCLHIILKCQCNIIYTYKRTKHILNNACRHCQVPSTSDVQFVLNTILVSEKAALCNKDRI